MYMTTEVVRMEHPSGLHRTSQPLAAFNSQSAARVDGLSDSPILQSPVTNTGIRERNQLAPFMTSQLGIGAMKEPVNPYGLSNQGTLPGFTGVAQSVGFSERRQVRKGPSAIPTSLHLTSMEQQQLSLPSPTLPGFNSAMTANTTHGGWIYSPGVDINTPGFKDMHTAPLMGPTASFATPRRLSKGRRARDDHKCNWPGCGMEFTRAEHKERHLR